MRLDQVTDWLKQNEPDVLCLQELKMPDGEFPHAAFSDLGYHSVATGQKTYNGVALISRHSARNVIIDLPGYADEQRRFISADFSSTELGDYRIVNVYVPNGQALDSDKFAYKREWFSHLIQAMKDSVNQTDQLVLVGDFNIAPTDLDVHDPQKWKGKIHCSDIERTLLHKLMATGLYDSFRHLHSEGERFSWWDYRTDGYSSNEGLRIDLILSSSNMLDALASCHTDELPRALERPSDHAPVVAEFRPLS